MRISSFVAALAVLVTAVAGCSDAQKDSEMGCAQRDHDHGHDSRDLSAIFGRDSTNAELLRRGLPLNNPVLRRGTPARRTAPSSVPPPVKITYSGIIEVHNAANGNLLGYVSKNLVNGGAQYGYDPSSANALLVSFQTDGTGSGTDLDISAKNSNPSWPLLGLVQGRDNSDSNLSSGSYQYGYLGGVANPGTQPGDKPTLISNSYFIGSPRTAETAVWAYNGATGVLTPQWINTDGSAPKQQSFTQSGGLYIGGNADAFHSRFPAPVTLITFKFVSQ